MAASYRLTFGRAKWIIRALTATACGIIKATRFQAPVAQLDRVSGYEPEGRRFESFRARQKCEKAIQQRTAFFLQNHIPVYLQWPPLLQLEEQHSSLELQDPPLGWQLQFESSEQSKSSQSVVLSQSLSTPSVQLASLPGGVPQSCSQLH